MRTLSTFFLLLWAIGAQATSITFRVDMSQVTVSPNGVHIAGSFQNWTSDATPMTDDGNGVYSYTTDLVGGNYQFKFINGNSWGSDEQVPAGCGTNNGSGGYNRFVDLAAAPIDLALVCFGACTSCSSITFSQVTLRVDMSQQTVSPNGVHVAGSFQNWSPGTTALTDANADGIYEITVSIESGTEIQYKFINGNDWPQSELVPTLCGVSDGFGGFNRNSSIGTEATTLPVICFGACAPCVAGPPAMVSVTFSVDMSIETVSVDGVNLAGEFQNWDPASTPMTDSGNGMYSVTLDIEEGSYAYKFINGNTFANQETVPSECGMDDGFGGLNRSLTAAGEQVILPTVCFSSCVSCLPVEPVPVSVTFQVDMSQETVSPEGVHIAGDFQGWDTAASPMTDEGNGIWSFTTILVSGTAVQYKFLNGNTSESYETLPNECAQDNNRYFTVGIEDTTLPVVCFSACAACSEQPEMVMVLFQVDMSNTTVSAQGVHLAGNFQGWNPNGTAMTDIGGGLFEILYPVTANTTALFRFINGSEWAQSELVPVECGIDDGFGAFNRSLEVLNENTAYSPVCFSSCEACVPSVPVLVTFRVNMNNETVSGDGVFVTGDFNEWSPTATAMSEFEPGVFQAVGVVNSGQTISYKFLNGPDFIGVENVPSDCGEADGFGGFNRFYTAETSNEIIPVVCFSGCEDCQAGSNVTVTFRVDMSEQTVSPDGVHVAGSFNGFSPTASEMTLVSPGVFNFTANVPASAQLTFKYINGNDFAFVETVPFECGVNDGFGGFNRTAVVGTSSLMLDEVCFSSCSDCALNVGMNALELPSIFPNPSEQMVWINPGAAGSALARVYDGSGRLVTTVAGNGSAIRQVNASNWSAGMYTIYFEGTDYTTRMIIR